MPTNLRLALASTLLLLGCSADQVLGPEASQIVVRPADAQMECDVAAVGFAPILEDLRGARVVLSDAARPDYLVARPHPESEGLRTVVPSWRTALVDSGLVWTTTLEDFDRANQTSRSLACDPRKFGSNTTMEPEGSLLDTFHRVRDSLDQSPAGLAAGPRLYILRVSHVGFSPDATQAIMTVDLYCGPLCASGHLLILDRDARHGWRIAQSILMWVS